MHILVLLKMVPDVVEELEVAPDNIGLDPDFLRMILSESDDCALEQALLLKERHGARITVMALEAPEVEDALFAALAKGADRAIKVTGGMETRTTREAAAVLAEVVATEPNLASADMVLTGVQAIDDLDGLIAPLLADRLAMPYLGIVTRLEVDPAGTTATALKEYPDGYRGEFEVSLPAVFGMQAAERPPRYVPVAKVRATRKSQTIECIPAPGIPEHLSMVRTLAMGKPAAGEGAQIFEGSPEVVCGKLCGVLAERGLL